KQRSYFAPIAFADDAARTVERVRLENKRAGDMGEVQFVVDQSLNQALVRRDAVERDACRRLKPGRAAVAHLFAAFHVPMTLILRHTEVVFQDAANPERRGLLILGNAEFFAGKVFWLRDAGVC